jgi:hypothetical protein
MKTISGLENGFDSPRFALENCTLYRVTKSGSKLIVIPKSLRAQVISLYHLMSHSGAEKLKIAISMRYWWRNMREDVSAFCKGCVLCSIFKSANIGPNEIGIPRLITEPHKYYQIDICSGLPSVNGKKSFLTIIDLFTGYVIPFALSSEKSENIARIISENIIKIFGPPYEISSDNASNLDGPEMKKILHFYNIRHRKTVPYSPTSHSNVENANRYITELVRLFSDQFQVHWTDSLTIASLVYNSMPRTSLKGHSPFYMEFQKEPFGGGGEDAILSVPDIEEYLKNSINDRNFARLTREYLLRVREKKNKAKNFTYRSYPPGTLILV